MILPRVESRQDYAVVYADDAVWWPAMQAICERHGLDPGALRRGVLGTHVVFHTGGSVVKLFCPLWGQDLIAERAVLTHVQGLPIPELVAQGQLAGWHYLVMTRVLGTPAEVLSGSLDHTDQMEVVRQLGTLMCELHSQPPVPELVTDWDDFLGERIAQSDQHHGASGEWRRWIRQRVEEFSEPAFDPVLLSADITSDHVLLGRRDGRWHITGLIDFGDAMMGHPHYDFVAPFVCFTFGCPELTRELVAAYGLTLTPDLAECLTTYCLLHRFARVQDFLDRCPVENGRGFWRALWGDL